MFVELQKSSITSLYQIFSNRSPCRQHGKHLLERPFLLRDKILQKHLPVLFRAEVYQEQKYAFDAPLTANRNLI